MKRFLFLFAFFALTFSANAQTFQVATQVVATPDCKLRFLNKLDSQVYQINSDEMVWLYLTTSTIKIKDNSNDVTMYKNSITSPTFANLPSFLDSVQLSCMGGGGGSGVVQTIVPGTNITVDATDPANPIVSATGSYSGTTFYSGDSSVNAFRTAEFQRGLHLKSDSILRLEVNGDYEVLINQRGFAFLHDGDSIVLGDSLFGFYLRNKLPVTLQNQLVPKWYVDSVASGGGVATTIYTSDGVATGVNQRVSEFPNGLAILGGSNPDYSNLHPETTTFIGGGGDTNKIGVTIIGNSPGNSGVIMEGISELFGKNGSIVLGGGAINDVDVSIDGYEISLSQLPTVSVDSIDYVLGVKEQGSAHNIVKKIPKSPFSGDYLPLFLTEPKSVDFLDSNVFLNIGPSGNGFSVNKPVPSVFASLATTFTGIDYTIDNYQAIVGRVNGITFPQLGFENETLMGTLSISGDVSSGDFTVGVDGVRYFQDDEIIEQLKVYVEFELGVPVAIKKISLETEGVFLQNNDTEIRIDTNGIFVAEDEEEIWISSESGINSTKYYEDKQPNDFVQMQDMPFFLGYNEESVTILAPDALLGSNFHITNLNESSFLLDLPTNLINGGEINVVIKADATTPFSSDSGYEWEDNFSEPTNIPAGKIYLFKIRRFESTYLISLESF